MNEAIVILSLAFATPATPEAEFSESSSSTDWVIEFPVVSAERRAVISEKARLRKTLSVTWYQSLFCKHSYQRST